MAGEPSLISGEAGAINAGGYNPSSQTTGQQMLQLVQAVQSIKDQKQAAAKDALNTQIEMLTKLGIPPDEKTFTKNAKDAGVDISHIQAAVNGQPGQPAPGTQAGPTQPPITPQAIVAVGNAMQGDKQGAQSATPVSPSAAEKAPGGGVGNVALPAPLVEQAMGGGGAAVASQPGGANGTGGAPQTPLTPLEGMIQRATQSVQQSNTTALHQSQLQDMIAQLKMQAGQGGEQGAQAVGKLMNMGGVDFNADQQTWNQMTPEERGNYVAIKAGQESPAARETRLSNQAMTLFNNGRFSTLADARKFAEGQTVPMKPDLERSAQEAQLYGQYAQLGLTTSQSADVAKKVANGVPLNEALPPGVTPVIQQELALKTAESKAMVEESRARTGIAQSELGIKQKELDVTLGSAQAEAALRSKQFNLENNKFLFDIQSKTDEAFQKRVQDLIEMDKASPGSVPLDIKKGVLNELATKGGMTPEWVDSWYNYMTYKALWPGNWGAKGGLNPSFKATPTVGPEDRDLINKGAGPGQQMGGGKSPISKGAGVPPISAPLVPGTKVDMNSGAISVPGLEAVTNAVGRKNP